MSALVNPATIRAARSATALSVVVRREDDSLAARVLGWMRRLAGARAAVLDVPLRAEARLSLGPKKSVVLVNCCGRRVLLGLCGDTMVPLGEWSQTKAGAKSRAAGKEAVR
jgi:hypothetical protein